MEPPTSSVLNVSKLTMGQFRTYGDCRGWDGPGTWIFLAACDEWLGICEENLGGGGGD